MLSYDIKFALQNGIQTFRRNKLNPTKVKISRPSLDSFVNQIKLDSYLDINGFPRALLELEEFRITGKGRYWGIDFELDESLDKPYLRMLDDEENEFDCLNGGYARLSKKHYERLNSLESLKEFIESGTTNLIYWHNLYLNKQDAMDILKGIEEGWL